MKSFTVGLGHSSEEQEKLGLKREASGEHLLMAYRMDFSGAHPLGEKERLGVGHGGVAVASLALSKLYLRRQSFLGKNVHVCTLTITEVRCDLLSGFLEIPEQGPGVRDLSASDSIAICDEEETVSCPGCSSCPALRGSEVVGDLNFKTVSLGEMPVLTAGGKYPGLRLPAFLS